MNAKGLQNIFDVVDDRVPCVVVLIARLNFDGWKNLADAHVDAAAYKRER